MAKVTTAADVVLTVWCPPDEVVPRPCWGEGTEERVFRCTLRCAHEAFCRL